MNELQLLESKGTMTSLEIAEITGKEHYNILRDVRDEIDKLGTERGQLIFEESYYINEQNKKQPMYVANVQGILQLGARYSADVRYRLIEKVTKKETVETKEDVFKNDLLDIEKDKIRLEKSRILKELSQSFTNEKYRETLQIYSANALYDEPILELPAIEKKSYTATEIGKKLGITSMKVGSIAKKHNLKTKEFGFWAYDKAKYSNKQVESFRYYDNVIDEIKKYI
ncbi:phage regulatory protein Rha [Leptotrichia wadei]|uniref:Phage regulatory protein Rha n=1 Tax=Leptotrichia wadei TaxID=157687 RepID=A0A510K9V4_9FUSO|nr:Rha family transcriptional regulator [Leptotrichia wadei]BBM48429.1 phage regulatory protein Rha [Leptotrichia wadei]